MPLRDRPLNECNGLPVPELPLRRDQWAVFLDIDGTLLELAPTPDEVVVPSPLVSCLLRLHTQLDGALGLVSGRSVDEVDRLFVPGHFAVAGVHGAELRLPGREVHRIGVAPNRLDPARGAFERFASGHPGTIVEDKGVGVALHFRRRPTAGEDARRLGRALVEQLGPEFQLLDGKMLVEIRASTATKGVAVEALLHEPPFIGRQPMYVGDDVTDEDAFHTVNRMGGVSVIVGEGRETAARYRLADVAAVHTWLRQLEGKLDRLG